MLANLRLSVPMPWKHGPSAVLIAIVAQPGNERTLLFLETILRNTRRGRFFVTKGLRIGLAPLDAAIGDRIAIMASGNAPFVLRQVPMNYAGQEAYRIIGGCAVDGNFTRQATFRSTC